MRSQDLISPHTHTAMHQPERNHQSIPSTHHPSLLIPLRIQKRVKILGYKIFEVPILTKMLNYIIMYKEQVMF